MLKFKKIKGNFVHKTAVINWKKIKIGTGNVIGPYVVIGNVPQWKNKRSKFGPFVYRLGHVVFILERGVRFP